MLPGYTVLEITLFDKLLINIVLLLLVLGKDHILMMTSTIHSNLIKAVASILTSSVLTLHTFHFVV